jgi:hypothetical protein
MADRKARTAARRAKKAAQRKKKAASSGSDDLRFWYRVFGDAIRFASATLASPGDVALWLTTGRLVDGQSVLEGFVARTDLSEKQKQVVRGWKDLRVGLFEKLTQRGKSMVLRDLVTWESLSVRTTAAEGLGAFAQDPVAATIVVPLPSGWMLGGIPQRLRPRLPQSELYTTVFRVAHREARRVCAAHPEVLARMLADEHRAFVEEYGGPMFVCAGNAIVERLTPLQDRLGDDPIDGLVPIRGLALSREILEAPEVGVLHDPEWGIVLEPGLQGFLDAVRAGDTVRVEAWMRDGRIGPAPFRLAAAVAPDALDRVLSEVRDQEDFRWPTHGDALLRALKPTWYPPLPGILPLPAPVVEGYDPSLPVPADGVGMTAIMASPDV